MSFAVENSIAKKDGAKYPAQRIQHAADITAAKALTLEDEEVVIIPGKGAYRFDASSTLDADDSLWVIEPSSGVGRLLHLGRDLFTERRNIHPEMFGAVGDGSTDDTAAFTSMIAAFSEGRVILTKNYLITSPLSITNKSLSWVGPGTITLESGTGVFQDALVFDTCSNFVVSNVKITSNQVVTNAEGVSGLDFTDCTGFRVHDCEVEFFTDAIACTTCTGFIIDNNDLHELGEEGVAVRSSRSWSVTGNEIYHHSGDGILVKVFGGHIEGNRVRDGVDTYGPNVGGGITCNTENNETDPVEPMRIISNELDSVNYGISLIGAQWFVIADNDITDIVGTKGIQLLATTDFNPEGVASGRGIIANNLVDGTANDAGISCVADDATLHPIVVEGNVVRINNIVQNAFRCENCIVTGNLAEGPALTLYFLTNCLAVGNEGTGTTQDVAVKIFEDSHVIANRFIGMDKHVQLRADFTGSFSHNIVETTSVSAGVEILAGAEGTARNNRITADSAPNTIIRSGDTDVDRVTIGGRVDWGTAAPTTGTWSQGDITYNESPSAGEPSGWVCESSGTPGTWRPLPPIPELAGTMFLDDTNPFVRLRNSNITNDNWYVGRIDSVGGTNTRFRIILDRNGTESTPVFIEEDDLIFTTQRLRVVNATFDEPIRFEGRWFWIDANGYFRFHNSAPSADTDGRLFQTNLSNTTANRPASPTTGEMFFDTSLGHAIWWDGTNWVDATGTTV